ncbi:MAG: hypothetical protein ACHREM_11395 [Polyangiales bacterium]
MFLLRALVVSLVACGGAGVVAPAATPAASAMPIVDVAGSSASASSTIAPSASSTVASTAPSTSTDEATPEARCDRTDLEPGKRLLACLKACHTSAPHCERWGDLLAAKDAGVDATLRATTAWSRACAASITTACDKRAAVVRHAIAECNAGTLTACILHARIYFDAQPRLEAERASATTSAKRACDGKVAEGCTVAAKIADALSDGSGDSAALKFLTRACELGSVDSCCDEARRYQLGRGTAVDKARADRLRIAAQRSREGGCTVDDALVGPFDVPGAEPPILAPSLRMGAPASSVRELGTAVAPASASPRPSRRWPPPLPRPHRAAKSGSDRVSAHFSVDGSYAGRRYEAE